MFEKPTAFKVEQVGKPCLYLSNQLSISTVKALPNWF